MKVTFLIKLADFLRMVKKHNLSRPSSTAINYMVIAVTKHNYSSFSSTERFSWYPVAGVSDMVVQRVGHLLVLLLGSG